MVKDLKALRGAPVIEPYTGPAILSGRASGVFFHEIFGPRIEGHRQKNESEGQTFTKKVTQPPLPDLTSVIADPTAHRTGALDLKPQYALHHARPPAEEARRVAQGLPKIVPLSR